MKEDRRPKDSLNVADRYSGAEDKTIITKGYVDVSSQGHIIAGYGITEQNLIRRHDF